MTSWLRSLGGADLKIKQKIEIKIPLVLGAFKPTLIEVADVWVPYMNQYNKALAGGIMSLRRVMVNMVKKSPTPGTFTRCTTMWTHACMKRDGLLLLSGWAYKPESEQEFDNFIKPWLIGESVPIETEDAPIEEALF